MRPGCRRCWAREAGRPRGRCAGGTKTGRRSPRSRLPVLSTDAPGFATPARLLRQRPTSRTCGDVTGAGKFATCRQVTRRPGAMLWTVILTPHSVRPDRPSVQCHQLLRSTETPARKHESPAPAASGARPSRAGPVGPADYSAVGLTSPDPSSGTTTARHPVQRMNRSAQPAMAVTAARIANTNCIQSRDCLRCRRFPEFLGRTICSELHLCEIPIPREPRSR